MKLTAEVKINQYERDNTLYSEKEFDEIIFNDLTIAFAKELRKMSPLQFKVNEYGWDRYQIQGIVIPIDF